MEYLGRPDKYIGGQLRAIVGIEVTVEQVHGKAKFSQNRSAADQEGVVTGLRQEHSAGAAAVADEMAARSRDDFDPSSSMGMPA